MYNFSPHIVSWGMFWFSEWRLQHFIKPLGPFSAMNILRALVFIMSLGTVHWDWFQRVSRSKLACQQEDIISLARGTWVLFKRRQLRLQCLNQFYPPQKATRVTLRRNQVSLSYWIKFFYIIWKNSQGSKHDLSWSSDYHHLNKP